MGQAIWHGCCHLLSILVGAGSASAQPWKETGTMHVAFVQALWVGTGSSVDGFEVERGSETESWKALLTTMKGYVVLDGLYLTALRYSSIVYSCDWPYWNHLTICMNKCPIRVRVTESSSKLTFLHTLEVNEWETQVHSNPSSGRCVAWTNVTSNLICFCPNRYWLLFNGTINKHLKNFGQRS